MRKKLLLIIGSLFLSSIMIGQTVRFSTVSMAAIKNSEINTDFPIFKKIQALVTFNLSAHTLTIKDIKSQNNFELYNSDEPYHLDNGDLIKDYDAFDYSKNQKCKVRLIVMEEPPQDSPSNTQLYLIYNSGQLILYLNHIETEN